MLTLVTMPLGCVPAIAQESDSGDAEISVFFEKYQAATKDPTGKDLMELFDAAKLVDMCIDLADTSVHDAMRAAMIQGLQTQFGSQLQNGRRCLVPL